MRTARILDTVKYEERRCLSCLLLLQGDTRLQTGRHRQSVVSYRSRRAVDMADRRPALSRRQRATATGRPISH